MFVKNTGTNPPVRSFIVVAVYFQNQTLFTHTHQAIRFIQHTPDFSATGSVQHQKLQSVGRAWTWTSILSLGQASYQVLGQVRDVSSFLPSS